MERILPPVADAAFVSRLRPTLKPRFLQPENTQPESWHLNYPKEGS
jgi:hypothetical protein